MIKTSQRSIHWDYYLALESDIKEVARYIEFDKSNFNTHSIELSHLLLAASSEVDVVMKELCNILNPKSKADNINRYKKLIKEHLPEIIQQNVISPLYGLTLSPWSNWKGNSNPSWWQSYNKVKHERNIHYKSANLKNVLNSVAGLFVANIHYNLALLNSKDTEYPYDLRNSIDNLKPKSGLFRLDDPLLYLGE